MMFSSLSILMLSYSLTIAMMWTFWWDGYQLCAKKHCNNIKYGPVKEI